MEDDKKPEYSIVIEVRLSRARSQDDSFVEYFISGRRMDCHRVFSSGKNDGLELICNRLIYLVIRRGHGYPPSGGELDKQIARARDSLAREKAILLTPREIYFDEISERYKSGVKKRLLIKLAKCLRVNGLQVIIR